MTCSEVSGVQVEWGRGHPRSKLKLKLKLEFPIASKYYYIVVPDLVGGARLVLNYYAMTSTGL